MSESEKQSQTQCVQSPTQFVHLHVHTEYSLLDGATKIKDLFAKCARLGMPAVAMTDHGNMFAMCKFDAAAIYETLKKGIEAEDWAKMNMPYAVKPIFGCEFYVCDDMNFKQTVDGKSKYYHLILLAKNYDGLVNLCELNSAAYIDGFYYKPRIDHKLLEKYCDGLVCLSACIGGEIPQALLNETLPSQQRFDNAMSLAKYYHGLFGEDFYIEIQDHGMIEQRLTNPQLLEIAKTLGVKPVATNDVHYLNKEDAQMQKVLQLISFKSTLMEAAHKDKDNPFNREEFYLKSAEEMSALFEYCPEAISNTLEIANKCNVLLRYKQDLIPQYVAPNSRDNYEFMHTMVFEGLEKKYGSITAEIRERAEYELDVIRTTGYIDYFLIVWDFIHYAESVGIAVGPGRGSGVGSIVAYAIGITKVDPLKYALFFERFLNLERVSMPDFDIDFCVARRAEVIDYVVKKYGADHVSQIVTFGTLAMKAAIKDVGRVYALPFADVNKITKSMPPIPPSAHVHLTDLLGRGTKKPDEKGYFPPSQDMIDLYESDEKIAEILDMSCKVEGFARQTGMHAAGVVICRNRIAHHVPQARSGEDITTQIDMIEVEKMGMLKMDFLGLRTLTDISAAQALIKESRGLDIDVYAPDFCYEDKAVFDMIGAGDTHSVFQLESEGMKNFMKQLKPNSLEDIIAGISLYRPGPMDSIPEYIKNKNNPDQIFYCAPCVKDILSVTYGCLVYQEQVMKLVQDMAGFSLGSADILRRAMSKKKKTIVEAHEEIFLHGGVPDGKGAVRVPGAIARGISETDARIMYAKILKFAEYAFNKSHATAYAFLSYQTAYLKCHYPVEFITAILNNRISSSDEIKNYLPYAKSLGIKILPPDVRKSGTYFTVEDGCIRIGLAAIKNIGTNMIDRVIEDRLTNGSYKDFPDYVRRVANLGGTKKLFDNVIFAGACDCFNLKRSVMIYSYEDIVGKNAKLVAAREMGQFTFFDDGQFEEEYVFADLNEYEHVEKLKKEKEVLNMYVSGHPLEAFSEVLEESKDNCRILFATGQDEGGDDLYENIKDGQAVELSGMLIEAGRFVSKKGNVLGMGKLEDFYGVADLMISGRDYERLKDEFNQDEVVKIGGRIGLQDGKSPVIWVNSIMSLADLAKDGIPKKKEIQQLWLRFDMANVEEQFEKDLNEILSSHPGDSKIFAYDISSKKVYPYNNAIKITKALLWELLSVLPEDDVKVKTVTE